MMLDGYESGEAVDEEGLRIEDCFYALNHRRLKEGKALFLYKDFLKGLNRLSRCGFLMKRQKRVLISVGLVKFCLQDESADPTESYLRTIAKQNALILDTDGASNSLSRTCECACDLLFTDVYDLAFRRICH